MKPLSITIEPPITEHCKKCDYQASRSFGSYLRKCPKCGENSICHGPRPKKEKAMYALRSRGSFNWADPSEKQWQYTSLNTPNGKNYSFVVDDELETDDVFELANNLKIIYSKYLYAGRMKDITELVELMDTEEFAIRQEKLLTEEKREQLERELYELNYYTKCYDGVK